MDWQDIREILPKDGQKIVVYDEGLKKELYRTFSIKFWKENKRILWCSEQCRKWKPV